MKLTKTIMEESELLIEQGYRLPQYEIDKLKENHDQLTWIHFGASNIFRAFLAPCQQRKLNNNDVQTGICVAEGYDYEIVDHLKKYDNLTINVTIKQDGEIEKEVIASIFDYLKMDSMHEDFDRLKKIFKLPSLQMVSLTITEKGYSLLDNSGAFTGLVKNDFSNGPKEPQSYIGKLVALLIERFEENQLPLALVSMDNMSRNGEKLEESIVCFAKKWLENGFVSKAFVDYLMNSEKITFPWTMIDKITPRPNQSIQKMIEATGFSDMYPIETEKHTFLAPFVNGEETQYLVIEDSFPNGRPNLEQTGIFFDNRETIKKVETMKVSTCLNPLHTGLAIFGCLLGFTSIHEEMKDKDLYELVMKLGYQEGLPVVTNPGIIDPENFLREVIDKRLPNAFIPDTPQRIATDTSQKLSVRFGETIKKYAVLEKQNELEAIPLVIAAWFRYLMGIDDQGNSFEPSVDPLLGNLKKKMEKIVIGKKDEKLLQEVLVPILKRADIFGLDVTEIGLEKKILRYFAEMISGTDAVRTTLHNAVLK